MANIARIRLPGFWIQNSVVDPDEFEALDEIRPWLANFTAGSSHTPSGFVTVGGSGFQLTGTGHEIATSARLNVQSTGAIYVADGGTIKLNGTGAADIDLKVSSGTALIDAESGSAIRIKSGASLDIFGTVAVKSGGTTTWESGGGGTLNSGATLTLASGSTTTAAGTVNLSGQIAVGAAGSITGVSGALVLFVSGSTVTLQGTNNLSSLNLVGASTWPTMTTTRTVTRPAVRVIPLTFNNGASTVGPSDPDAWECLSDVSTAPAWRTRTATTSGKVSILEITDLPIGVVITGASVTTKGTEAGSVASTLPTYQIISWATGGSPYTAHSTATSDGSASFAFPLTDTTTSITATGATNTRTVTAGRRYGIRVTHPYESGGGQGLWVYEATITADATSIQI